MKKTLLTLGLAFPFLINAQVTNLGLEAWSGVEPDGWFTLNVTQGIGANQSTIQETTGASEGTSYARLVTVACAMCPAFQVPDPHPGLLLQEVAFNGVLTSITVDVKANLQAGDKAIIGATTTLAGNPVDGGGMEIETNSATWATITIPFIGAACDSISLAAASSGSIAGGTGTDAVGTELSVDNWVLNGSVGIHKVTLENLKIYPNPASEFITIETEFNLGAVEFFDMSGRMVKSVAIDNNDRTISVNDLSTGVYTVRIKNTDNTDARIQRLVIK